MKVLQRKSIAAVLSLGTAFLAAGQPAIAQSATQNSANAKAVAHTTRRHRLAAAAVSAAAAASAEVVSLTEDFRLKLHNMHTGESLDIVYRVGDTYLPEAVEKLNYFLRDHYTQDVANYDPKEFDVLHNVLERLRRPDGIIEVVCGYRTPETNEALRQNSRRTGVAEHSQHMEGHAIDLRVPGVSTAAVRNAALSLHAGGVGYYPVSQFVHVDVGPVRHWVFAGSQHRPVRRSRTSHVTSGM
jgi:uncharacterized protein YcbK (DUF882 family)